VGDLPEADVTGTDVTGTDVTGTDVTGADVTGADVRGTDAHDVAARLRRLAAGAPGAGDTADRALAANRHRRLRAARWVAAGVAVVVLGTAATLARPEEVVAAAQPAPSSSAGTPPPQVYEQPARGSLADDAGFLAQAATLPWSGVVDPASGALRQVEPDSRRVVYAADVPGGHRWVVVMARWQQQWAVNWFSGPRGADPSQLVEAYAPLPWSGLAPLAVMDASESRGPLLVLAEPGVSAEYSPGRDRAPDGRLVRDFDPLPVVDGALLGSVTTPLTWDSGELYQVRGASRSQVYEVHYTHAPWDSWYSGVGEPPEDAVVAECLTALGLQVQDGPGAQDVAWSESDRDEITSAEVAARDEAAAACHVQASGG
jgi:hypothetical protein